MTAVRSVMLLNGMDPTVISVFYDLVKLEFKMVHRKKQKQKLSSIEIDLRKVTLDLFIKAQLWHLGLVVLKQRKAAKAWHLRFELIKMLHAVDKFVLNSKAITKPLTNKLDTYASQGEDQEAVRTAVLGD